MGYTRFMPSTNSIHSRRVLKAVFYVLSFSKLSDALEDTFEQDVLE